MTLGALTDALAGELSTQTSLLKKALDQEAQQVAQLMQGLEQIAPAPDPSAVKGMQLDIRV